MSGVRTPDDPPANSPEVIEDFGLFLFLPKHLPKYDFYQNFYQIKKASLLSWLFLLSALLLFSGEKLIHSVSAPAGELIRDVLVDVLRRRHVGVAELMAYQFDVHALKEKERRRRVA